MTRAMPIDEVCFRITDALRAGRLDGWARGFAAGVAKSLKRPNWCPSQKQEAVMRQLVAEIRREGSDLREPEIELIDRAETMEMRMEMSDPAH
jgi:hypothetical protein